MSLLQAASKFWAGAPRPGSLGKIWICPEQGSPLRSSAIWNFRSFGDCVRCHPGGETYRAMSKLSFAAAIRAEKRTTNASSAFMRDSPARQPWPPAYRDFARGRASDWYGVSPKTGGEDRPRSLPEAPGRLTAVPRRGDLGDTRGARSDFPRSRDEVRPYNQNFVGTQFGGSLESVNSSQGWRTLRPWPSFSTARRY